MIIHGNSVQLVRDLGPFDAIVTDPPYELGFMGRSWDSSGVAFCPDTWRAYLDAAKPGAHLVAFGGSRTYHRIACAIEDAGWVIRDCLHWIYGSGFPKSHNLGGEWDGWGTALKPAFEPIILARKPFCGSVATNVLEHGTGALNIDGCRIIGDYETRDRCPDGGGSMFGTGSGGGAFVPASGRWPANIILGCACGREHDPGCAVAMLDAQSGELAGRGNVSPERQGGESRGVYGDWHVRTVPGRSMDSGGASRFFYVAKASREERERGLEHRKRRNVNDGRATSIDNAYQRGDTQRANTHPTVKPLALMRWLVRLVTPPGGHVLDPFCGSGTTGMACAFEGFKFTGIDLEQEHCEIARARIAQAVEDAGGLSAEEADAKARETGAAVQLGLKL